MDHGKSVAPAAPCAGGRVGLADLVEDIGTEGFGEQLMRLLHHTCGANHFAAFQLDPDAIHPVMFSSMDAPRTVGTQVRRYVNEGWWRKDPAIRQARLRLEDASTDLIRLQLDDVADLREAIYPRICDAVMVCGRRSGTSYGLSILSARPRPAFGPAALETLHQLAGTLVSAMAKHASFRAPLPDAARALTRLPDIEDCLLATSDLPRRELEVSARILYGMSTSGISLDLGIGEESVKTYRKRAYQRLRIGCERELLHHYLTRWTHWQQGRAETMPRAAVPGPLH